MYNNFILRNIDEALPALAHHVLSGELFESRNGSTRDVTHIGVTLTHPRERYITNKNRKHNLAAQIAETMWVLSGRDDVEWLSRYLPRAADFSDDGKVWRGAYGKRIRRWPSAQHGEAYALDQVAHVVAELKKDPNTRRAVIAIYDPEVDMDPGKDIPCNDFLTFSIRGGKLDVGVTIRSNDLMWGWSGINAFEWSVLQEMVAELVGVEVGFLHFSITSLHLYEQHWKRATEMVLSPGAVQRHGVQRFNFPHDSMYELDDLFSEWFAIEELIRTGAADAANARLNSFPEPMLRDWLFVLLGWWTGNDNWVPAYLLASFRAAVQPKQPEPEPEPEPVTIPFVDYVTKLHTEKHAAYGDSWRRRGEMLGIMANIARKIDRLGGGETQDETQADTAIDLLVYLCKYRWWLTQAGKAPRNTSGSPAEDADLHVPNWIIQSHIGSYSSGSTEFLANYLRNKFDMLEQQVVQDDHGRYRDVDDMIGKAFILAQRLWEAEQK